MSEASRAAEPNVSVIVPFYNVRECIHYCVESLLAQTYRDYELILVDDGSTDGTGELLDSYQHLPCVRIFHKTNGGLSDARNFGVDKSCGRYITFVDGDDFVSPYYLQALTGAMDNKSDRMVMGRFRNAPFSERAKFGSLAWNEPSQTKMSKRNVVKAILYDDIQPSAWAKLADRRLYEKIRFPLGARYEEIQTVMLFVSACSSFVVLQDPIYGYVMRRGSITWSKSITESQLRDYLTARDTIAADALRLFPEFTNAAQYQRSLLDVRLHSQLPAGTREDARLRAIDDEALADLRSRLPDVLKDVQTPIISKLRFTLLSICRPLYDMVFALYNRLFKLS